MRKFKQVLMGLVGLSLIVLIGVGIFLGQRFLVSSTPKGEHTTFKPKKETDASSSVELVEKAVVLLEEKQTLEALKVAQESVSRLANSKEKTSFLARISVVEAKLKNKDIFDEAERAVKYLEDNPDVSNISLAQEKVANITAPSMRKDLEARIKVVQEQLSQKEQGQQKAVPAAQTTPQVSQDVTEVAPSVPIVEVIPTPSVPVVERVTPTEPTQPDPPSDVNVEPPTEIEIFSPSVDTDSELSVGQPDS